MLPLGALIGRVVGLLRVLFTGFLLAELLPPRLLIFSGNLKCSFADAEDSLCVTVRGVRADARHVVLVRLRVITGSCRGFLFVIHERISGAALVLFLVREFLGKLAAPLFVAFQLLCLELILKFSAKRFPGCCNK